MLAIHDPSPGRGMAGSTRRDFLRVIDPAMTFMDYNGRPQYVLEDRVPVNALL
jgi:hypothetical protein